MGLAELKRAIFDIDNNCRVYGLFGTPIPFLVMFPPFFFKETWRNPKVMLIAFQVGTYLIYIVYKGFDWMDMFRFFMHIIPLLCLLSGLGFQMLFIWILGKANKKPICNTKPIILFFILILLGSALNAIRYSPKYIYPFISGFSEFPPKFMMKNYYNMGIWLKEQYKQGEIVAIGEAGAIPYLSKVTIIDMMGTMDKHIAHLDAPQHWLKFDADYVFSHKPDWILIMGYTKVDKLKKEYIYFLLPYSKGVYYYPEFKEHYRLAHQEGELLLYKRLKYGDKDPPGWEVEYRDYYPLGNTL